MRSRRASTTTIALALAGLLGRPSHALEPAGTGIPAGALSAYTPPACVAGVPFADVTCTTPYDAWIEQFARDGITGGCGGGNYCPGTSVTRDQMAVFIERAMRGTGNWPPHVATAWAVKDSAGNPDAAGSGLALLAAVSSIPTSGPDAPSRNNPWLIQVGPGVYDIGAFSIPLADGVTLRGSGRETTIIQNDDNSLATVLVAAGAQVAVRSLTLANTLDYFVVRANAGTGSGAATTVELDDVHLIMQGYSSEIMVYLADWCALTVFRSVFETQLNLVDSSGVWVGGANSYVVARDSDFSLVYYPVNLNGFSGILYNNIVDHSPTKTSGTFYCAGNVNTSMSSVGCP